MSVLLRELYVAVRGHMASLGGERVTAGGRSAIRGDDGRLCPIGRLMADGPPGAENHSPYQQHVRTPVTESVDRSLGRPLSPPEREFLSRVKRAHDTADPRDWGLMVDDAFAVAATRKRMR